MTDAREQPKVRAMLGRLRPALLGVLLLCFWSTLGAAQQGRVQRGRVFAQTNCAMCHAVGRIGDSPLAIAPPFRTLHTRYRVDDLAEALAEGIVTGHPSMPQFQLDAAADRRSDRLSQDARAVTGRPEPDCGRSKHVRRTALVCSPLEGRVVECGQRRSGSAAMPRAGPSPAGSSFKLVFSER